MRNAFLPRVAAVTSTSIAALSLFAAFGGAAHASVNLVQNGGFELLSGAPNNPIDISQPTDWAPYTGVQAVTYAPGTADTTGATYDGGGTYYLWGPNNGSANGLPAASPAGGNYIAFDADPSNARVFSQTITGLVAGREYALSFYWAAAQIANGSGGYNGATTDDFQVSLGGETQTTPSLSISSHGFSGWKLETLDFTATGSSEVLSFLAQGTAAVPPAALLDGVSLTGVPEPDTWAMMLFGFGGIGLAAYYRQRKRPVAV